MCVVGGVWGVDSVGSVARKTVKNVGFLGEW